ncbi:hypothetical protein AQUCO_03000197v1 [Aquilegia coerulea]|uniref:PPM-type phosphatase domain-containing protein n=2 Tax=Aquilegia coerulea TaxID=218851 RepID=A0A2G5D1S6_AQUCA|nr:hypothetical protein AQUCO_03000197v1 [Aquilegia coerulea]
MGVCCSKDKTSTGFTDEGDEDYKEEDICAGDWGARVRLKGSCSMASMFTQQGRKGINQDAMTIWEDFNGEPDKIFCGVFDGHGPAGHIVATHIRDVLPSKISLAMKSSEHNNSDRINEGDSHNDDKGCSKHSDKDETYHPQISSWTKSFIKAFEELDNELSLDPTIDSYCSGSTAVTLFRQEEHLLVANLGDSRAILCTRNKKKRLVPVQLTVDLKPNLPYEAERIKSCNGRVFAMPEEPNMCRLWLPDENSPGLAMSRAFGDFCLKDFGLISTPKVYYTKLSSKDEFVVLATDGVWDVLSNKDVVKIVASARKRSMAARLLVGHAVQAWKTKYPNSKIDDCAAICLFLKLPSSIAKATSGFTERSVNQRTGSDKLATIRNNDSHEAQETTTDNDSKEEWSALEGVTRVNTVLQVPRFSTDNSQKRSENKMLNDG